MWLTFSSFAVSGKKASLARLKVSSVAQNQPLGLKSADPIKALEYLAWAAILFLLSIFSAFAGELVCLALVMIFCPLMFRLSGPSVRKRGRQFLTAAFSGFRPSCCNGFPHAESAVTPAHSHRSELSFSRPAHVDHGLESFRGAVDKKVQLVHAFGKIYDEKPTA